jgi:hypothetical protein
MLHFELFFSKRKNNVCYRFLYLIQNMTKLERLQESFIDFLYIKLMRFSKKHLQQLFKTIHTFIPLLNSPRL